MLERILLGAAAVAAAVFAGIGVHSAALERSAERAGFRAPGTLTPARVAHAADLFERARKRNPDTLPEVNEAAMLTGVRQDERAMRLLLDVVDKEPDNVTAWVLLARAAAKSDPALAARAAARARKLNPPVAPLP